MGGSHGVRFLLLALLLVFIVGASMVSNALWGGKSEELPELKPLVMEEGMLLREFAEKNAIPDPVLKKVFGLETKEDLGKDLGSFGLTRDQITDQVKKSMVLEAEEGSKNWFKIPLKFALWLAFLGMVFVLMRKGRIVPKVRKYLYLTAIVVFGVIMGSDPSAMGTVKDAIHLYGAEGVVFPPRMIALTVFLLTVLVANKYICAWGCQVGALQDLIFRLGRNSTDAKGEIRQYKPSFLLTNTIRAAFFVIFTVVAFVWAVDIIGPVDPFKIYNIKVLGIGGLIFLGVLAGASLIVYRPWCHFLCPFGLVGWLVEKISIFKIKVNYETCIACEACARACPSTVMGAILKRDRVIPDCFACATCIDVCPTDSIAFTAGRREAPPEGHFDKKKKDRNPGVEEKD